MFVTKVAFQRIAMTLLAGVIAATPSMYAQGGHPTTTITQDLNFVPVGLAGSETLQINVINTAGNSANGTAASCSGNITFLNVTGNAIGTSTPFTVTSGQVFSATLKGTVGAARIEVRGQIAVTTTNAAPRVPCQLASSLETYDTSTGVTHMFLTGPSASVAVQPGMGLGR